MTTRALLLALVLVGAGSGSARGEEDPRGWAARDAAVLPLIAVRVVNDTEAMLSATISSATCPRVLLAPWTSTVVERCLRWGLVYHVRVVFYTATAVVERHDLLFLARPDQDWVFAGR